MPCPDNSIYIIIGEMNMVVTAMKRSNRWSSHVHQEEEQDNLLKSFNSLKDSINSLNDISFLEPIAYLSPFLDVIRSENTSGLVTGHGLSAIYKFLSYGLIDAKSSSSAVAAENIADAVTHARFMMTDSSSDEVVLMKIIQVLRLLLVTPLGALLSNESVCEVIQSFFRMCFETRFSEILRKTAENALTDAVQLLFSRLPQFTEDSRCTYMKKMKMRYSGSDKVRSKKKPSSQRKNQPKVNELSSPKLSSSPSLSELNSQSEHGSSTNLQLTDTPSADSDGKLNNINKPVDSVIPPTEQLDIGDQYCKNSNETMEYGGFSNEVIESPKASEIDNSLIQNNSASECNEINLNRYLSEGDHRNESFGSIPDVPDDSSVSGDPSEPDYVNPRGVRFTAHQSPKDGSGPLLPYGLPCVRELFRLLISLINPLDRHNSEVTIQIGLNLLTIALEAGADNLGKFNSLLSLIKDEMCRNLFALLTTERLPVYASALRAFFLLFEALRTYLKFQLEMFLTTLMEIIVSESPKVSYEQREVSLDCITQMWRIPGLVTEIYTNYDSDLYCSNLFEDITKVLSKNTFPLSGLYSVHLLSLDALLAVVDGIESHCHCRMINESKFSPEKSISSIDSNSESSPKSCAVLQGASGYLLGQELIASEQQNGSDVAVNSQEKQTFYIQPNRMKVSSSIPSHEELMTIKHRKKILASGTEQFNIQPSKGISFMQEHGLLKKPLDAEEVATFLRDNPQLDKKMIGDYISNRKNLKVLEAFVRSFAFEDIRIDEALRQYLETFRLPGEAPLISLIMEHFAEHWHKSNKQPFANNDAAFTLAYAIIMLNVDQHNHNVKKQNNPMTMEDFKKNLKSVNGGEDFQEDMIENIYLSIRTEEIVMPAEQTGLVKENYLWKVLLRRGNTKEGKFIHTPNGIFDHDLFSICWGPSVAALSYIFDKSTDATIMQKTLSGFHKCAMIAAHYGMCDVFDNLVISLCKFTSLLNSVENPKSLPIIFGSNNKAQMATKAVFQLAHCHGDILRDGWKNLIDCILQLYKANLLPQELIEAEDFVSVTGVVSLIREDVPSLPRIESSLFSSFYSYITSEPTSQKMLSQEDEALKQTAIDCINECHCDQLFTESKFLRVDSLQELVKKLLFVSNLPESTGTQSTSEEDTAVFVLELVIKIVLLNRDRVHSIWTTVQDHLFSLLMNVQSTDRTYLLERTVVGILRIAIRLVRKEEIISQVIESLQVLLLLKPHSLFLVSRQVANALHELLRTNAANIHLKEHWSIIFSLLERSGAGAKPLATQSSVINEEKTSLESYTLVSAQSDSELNLGHNSLDSSFVNEKGYTSDSELYESLPHSPSHRYEVQRKSLSHSEHMGAPDSSSIDQAGHVSSAFSLSLNQYNIALHHDLFNHDPLAFLKCCESLAFLVRDAAHITEDNFESCVHCIRTFVEASTSGGCFHEKKASKSKLAKEKRFSKSVMKKKEERAKKTHQHSKLVEGYDADDEKINEYSPAYQQVAMQLLDLMHTLHTRASSIFTSSESDNSSVTGKDLWNICWCPLLQGIARLCCDTRRVIRTAALTLLPRALLVHDLQALSPSEWESCFNKVLFPLLARLLEDISPEDPIGMEETRMRGATLLCKVFLQHLTPLLTLPTFMALWLTILDFMDKYMHADGSGLLAEAIPESLKNMLLVMDTAGVFQKSSNADSKTEDQMWHITWDRINSFLHGLKEEIFKPAFPIQTVVIEETVKEESKKEIIQEPISSKGMCSPPVLKEDLNYTYPAVPVILHPPVSPLAYTTPPMSSNYPSPPTSVITTSVPLLLSPAVICDGSVQVFNTQVQSPVLSQAPK